MGEDQSFKKTVMLKRNQLVEFIRDYYKSSGKIYLHEPIFVGREKEYLLDTINSTFVSSIGEYVTSFEDKIKDFTKSNAAVAVNNGTAAIHLALFISDIKRNDLVITPSFTFIAICNVLSHLGAEPIFIDIDKRNLGLCPISLKNFLETNCELNDKKKCVHKKTKKIIKAIVPMNAFGNPVHFDEIKAISKRWNLKVIEDSAESLGSIYKNKFCGSLSEIGILSFNGNKIITTGGGGMLLFKSKKIANLARHVSSTARTSSKLKFSHDRVGFNYRMPNLNAALGLAQMENIEEYLLKKRKLAFLYRDFFKDSEYEFINESRNVKSNFWLNSIICNNKKERDDLLKFLNKKSIFARAPWELMSNLKMFKWNIKDDLKNSKFIQQRLINLPSSVLKN